jgi:hypothetical protein
MKTLRQLLVASVVTLVLTVPAFAGQMDTMIPAPPPPAQPATAQGEISMTVIGQEDANNSEATATDSATEIALNLLQSVLSLF